MSERTCAESSERLGGEAGLRAALARDLRGGFVIVLVPDDGDDPDLVPGLLRRMGWVRKHLCAGGETVRAVAVMNEVPESASYAAAGLAEGVIRFVGYRFALEFHDHAG